MASYLWSYKPGSRGAKVLARGLGIKRIKHKGSRFRPRPDSLVINWGAGSLPFDCSTINPPCAVNRAGNKLLSLRDMQGQVAIPEWTTDVEVAKTWPLTVVRHKLRGKAGDGIEIVEEGEDMPDAPLYVRYVKSSSEWRVHVLDGESFLVHRKVRDPNIPAENVNWRVRAHGNGFIFQLNNPEVPGCVTSEAIKAVDALGLDFGAVDVLYRQKADEAYVLEVNTAPGLEGDTTISKYIQSFRKWI